MENIFGKFEKGAIGTILVMLVCLIVPGSFFLFLHDRILFASVDTFRLILLSLAVPFPVFTANIVLMAAGQRIEKRKNGKIPSADSDQVTLMACSVVTAPVVYLTAILKYFLSFGVGWAIIVAMVLQFVLYAGFLTFEALLLKTYPKGSTN